MAAEFVFDEISPECRSNYSNLVRELDLRFKCVETNKSYRALFSRLSELNILASRLKTMPPS